MNRRQVRRLIRRELQSPAYLDRMMRTRPETPETFRKALDDHRHLTPEAVRRLQRDPPTS